MRYLATMVFTIGALLASAARADGALTAYINVINTTTDALIITTEGVGSNCMATQPWGQIAIDPATSPSNPGKLLNGPLGITTADNPAGCDQQQIFQKIIFKSVDANGNDHNVICSVYLQDTNNQPQNMTTCINYGYYSATSTTEDWSPLSTQSAPITFTIGRN